MASVRKVSWTHNGVTKSAWQVTYTDPHTKKRPTKNFKAKKEADAYRLKVEKEIEAGVHTSAARTKTMADACKAFLVYNNSRVADGRIGATRLQVIKYFVEHHVIPAIGGVLMSDLTVGMIDTLYVSLTQKGLAPHVARQRIGLLKQIEDFAIRREWTLKAVVPTVLKDLRGFERPEQKRFEQEQVLEILETVRRRRARTSVRTAALLKCFVNIAAFCGLRFGEIRALTSSNVDFGLGIIKVRHNLTGENVLKAPKSKAGVRDVPMPSHVAALIREWMDSGFMGLEERGLIFTTKKEGLFSAPTFHMTCWRPLLDSIGLTPSEGEDYHHFHALRHFAASWWIDCGVPVTTVAKWLGHSKPDMTLEFYARSLVSKQDQREVADRMAERLLSSATVMDATRTRKESLTLCNC